MPWIICGLLVLIIIFLLIYKKERNCHEAKNYENELLRLKDQKKDLQRDIDAEYDLIRQNTDKIYKLKEQYKQELEQQDKDIKKFYEDQKEYLMAGLDQEYEARKAEKEKVLELQIANMEQAQQTKLDTLAAATQEKINELYQRRQSITNEVEEWETTYAALLAPYKVLEQEKMAKLFYTIQVPEEYRSDMEYLLDVVSQKVNHPDIISKLVWQEYVKPYIDDTFKRIEIKDEPGIYKLTNIDSGKGYIGRSTNIKKRITDHFKAAIGLDSISYQIVHDQILKTGIWNWTIQAVGYFPKEILPEKEKFYIKEFDTMNFGYNKIKGG